MRAYIITSTTASSFRTISPDNEKGRMGAGSCLFLAGNIGLHALGLGFTGIRLRFDSHWDHRSLG